MLRIYAAVAISALIGLASCAGSDDKSYVDKTVVPEGGQVTNGTQPGDSSATNVTAPATLTPGATTIIPGSNTFNTNQQIQPLTINPQSPAVTQTVQPNVVTTTQQPLQATAAGMNPPHGQPGHRCEISVGAPLNSKPAANEAAQPQVVTTQQPANNVTVTPQPAQKTAPGMNPPHGEPGHRCDISVGEPLNSKPAPPAATNVSTTVPALLAPVKPDSSKN